MVLKMNTEKLVLHLESIIELAVMAKSFADRNINKGFDDMDAVADYLVDIENDLKIAQGEVDKYYMERPEEE